MEVGDSGPQQRSVRPTSFINHRPPPHQDIKTSPPHSSHSSAPSDTDQRTRYPPYQQVRDSYRDQPPPPPMATATATVLPSGAHYHSHSSFPHPPPPPSTYSPHPSGPGPSINNMISSSEPRKPIEANDSSNRQSLPSLSEVISGAKPNQFPPPGPPSLQHGSGLPSPYVPAARHYSEPDRHSPQPMHPAGPYAPRQEPLPTFSDSPRGPFSVRPGLPPVSDRRPSPPSKHDVAQHHPSEAQKTGEPHHLSNGYAHVPPPPPPAGAYAPSQLPPGQVPLPAYPVSPRHAVPHMQGPYDPRGPGGHPEEAEYVRARYEGSVNRHFESWSYQESLSRIGSAARTIFNFAEAYGRIAQEQQGPHHIPERLPTEREMAEMLANAEVLKRSLDQMRELVMVSIQSSERAREGAKAKGPYEEDQDIPMYAEGVKPPYTMTEGKSNKRRGRAAPPGRCHSCNRIDTPEWRRGPDGARTLCNACGLHYAKLERKRQLEARTIRPKPEDRS